MHALEKLWKAAYVFHAEGSLEADLWVLDRTLRILSAMWVRSSRGSVKVLPNAAFPGPRVKRCGSRRLPLPEPHPDAL